MAIGMISLASQRPDYNGTLTGMVVICCFVAASSGFLFGYDLGITGGVTAMDPFLAKFFPKILERQNADAAARASGLEANNPYCSFNDQKLQAFTSTFFLVGFVTAMFAAPFQRKFGRRASMMIAGWAYVVGGFLMGFAQNLPMLVIGRAFLGWGVGFANASGPLYLAEMPLPRHRGFLNQGFQWTTCLGILVSGLVNYGTQHMMMPGQVAGWRVSVGLAAAFGLLLLIGAYFVPDTPNSMISRGCNKQDARKVLQDARGTGVDISREFDDICRAVEAAKHVDTWALLTKRKYRGTLTASIMIPFFQQFTGINTIMFFAADLFKILGKGTQASLLNVVIIGAVNVGATGVSMLLADRVGRRPLLLQGSSQMLVAFIIVAAVMAEGFDTTTGQVPPGMAKTIIAFECVFTSGFAWSWGPLGWLVPSEMHNIETRALGMGIATAVNFLASFIIGQTYLTMLCTMRWTTYVFFACMVILNMLYNAFLLPETAGRPVEDMEAVWAAHSIWGKICYPTADEREAIKARLDALPPANNEEAGPQARDAIPKIQAPPSPNDSPIIKPVPASDLDAKSNPTTVSKTSS